MLLIVFALFIFLLLIIISLDFFPQFYTWQSRIHIGRFNSKEIWMDKMQERALSWLHRTPVIKLTDNKRLLFIDMLRGNYKRAAIQHWQEAALILGLTEAYNKTQNEQIKLKIDTYLDKKIDSKGMWKTPPKEIDGVILAYAIINLKDIDHHKFKPALDYIWELIVSLKGTDGTVAYKAYSGNYRFVDTIGFICPFLISYGVTFQNEEAIKLSIKQITQFNEFGMLSDKFIPCHAYQINTATPVGLFGWGRGLGWYAIGLIDAWNALPQEHRGKEVLTGSVMAFAKMAVSFQNDNGSWNWIVSVKEANADSSTTATLAWFFKNAAKIPEIKSLALEASDKALSYLETVTRRNGAVDFSQGDTKAIGVHSQEFDILPFAQGFALRATYL